MGSDWACTTLTQNIVWLPKWRINWRGFILGTIINKASWTYGYIIWLGVNPTFHRRGIADKLVDKLVERMIDDGARFMMVDTDPENTPALKFFARKGFGNMRKHVYLSMNLSKHEYYGKLIAYEREKAERQVWKRPEEAIAQSLSSLRGCFLKSVWRLKPRLHKLSPPTRTTKKA